MVAAMSGGTWPRNKGARRERELVAAHLDIGVKAERVRLSGAARYRGNAGDIDVYPWGPEGPPLCCQVKARAGGEGFATLERWLGDTDAVFLRRDRADPLVVLPWQTWARLVPGMDHPGRRKTGPKRQDGTVPPLNRTQAAEGRIAGPAAIAANGENRLLQEPVAEAPEAPDIGPADSAPAAPAGDAVAAALDELVAAHEPTHGSFSDTAQIAQALKAIFAAAGVSRFGALQREALDQIAVKIARICAGDAGCAEHWLDLCGYCWLAGRDLDGGSGYNV
jgi:hypothetical protein